MNPFIPKKLPLQDVKWKPLIPLIVRANRSLAHFKGVISTLQNPALLFSPLNTQEAVLSSKIEGTQATLGEVLKFEAGEEPKIESRRLDIHEIINYMKALRCAEDELTARPFNLNLLLKIHDILLAGVRGKNKGRGMFRKTQNWIGTPGSPIAQAEFVPPDPMLVMEYLDNLEKYYHADESDPLVQLAVIHAQFEIIHPFLDGNGRIGRILIPIFLFEKELLPSPIFYLSAYLEEHRDEYISHLRALGQENDAWDRWIEFFLTALDEQAQQNAAKAQAIMKLYEEMKTRIIELTHSQYAVPLLDLMFKRPVFQSTDIKFPIAPKPSRQLIANLLRALRETSILKVVREGSGRRAQLLEFTELIDLCEK